MNSKRKIAHQVAILHEKPILARRSSDSQELEAMDQILRSTNRPGTTSTLIAFDFKNCAPIANQPRNLSDAIGGIITNRNLILRPTQLLDVWDGDEKGSSTIVRPLAESHTHVTCTPSQVRIETWPDEENDANGEVQLCDFSRDNRWLAVEVLVDIAALLTPRLMSITILQRNPMKLIRGPMHLYWSSAEQLLSDLKFLRSEETVA